MAKRILRERNKFNYLVLIAHDIAEQELAVSSPKLSFLVAKKAYCIVKRLKTEVADNREKLITEEYSVLSKIVLKEIEEVETFYTLLKNIIRTQ